MPTYPLRPEWCSVLSCVSDTAAPLFVCNVSFQLDNLLLRHDANTIPHTIGPNGAEAKDPIYQRQLECYLSDIVLIDFSMMRLHGHRVSASVSLQPVSQFGRVGPCRSLARLSLTIPKRICAFIWALPSFE